MPSSGWSPDFFEMGDQRFFQPPCRLVGYEARLPRDVESVEHFAVDVELQLLEGGVADPNRRGPLISRQPAGRVFGQPPFARNAVHDLQIGWAAGDSAAQPLAPRFGLGEESGFDQGVKRERRVTKPTKTIVPIARSTQLLGQRGCSCRDNSAGLPMCQRFQRQQRSQDCVGPLFRRFERRAPSRPEGSVLLESLRRVQRRGGGVERRRPGQREADFLSGGDLELADCAPILATKIDRRIEDDSIGSRGELAPAVFAPRRPRNDRTIFKSHDQLGPHRDRPAPTPHEADQVGRPIAPAQKIDYRGDAAVSLERRLQNQRIAEIAA